MSLFAAIRGTQARCYRPIRPKAFSSVFIASQSRSRGVTTSTSPAQPESPIRYIRNIGIVAHVDAGKTTTTEQMLYNSGALRHAGNVDHGDTVTDFLPMERQRGITIQSAAITFNWPKPGGHNSNQQPHIINLIDTPGHVDFRFEVERCMPILDGAVCVIDGVEGVEAHTERVWSSAREFKIPRFIFVNKLDREGASYKKSIQDIGLKLNGMPLVCQIPWWEDDTMKGVVDVITGQVVSLAGTTNSQERLSEIAVHSSIKDEIGRARERLIELLCERDDELLELWTDHGKDLSSEAIKKSIRRVLSSGDGSIIPVFAGSSLKNIGVVPLLNAVNDYLPSPLDRPELEVRNGKKIQPLGQILQPSQISKRQKQPHVEALASVFKVVNDARRGMLTWVRVYHGILKKNTPLWNANLQGFERPLNIMQISASQTVEVPYLAPGQIGALTGLKTARTGDTLMVMAANKAPPPELSHIQVRPPEIPPAVAFIVLDATSPTGARILETALENASREDPSIRWSKDEKTEQYTLSGMGTLHLEIARDRLENHYKAEAIWGKIVVDYKESLSMQTPPTRAVFDRTVAGNVGTAACTAVIEPLESHYTDTLPRSSYIERDGNIIRVEFPGEDHPFDVDATRQHLVNGAIAALARGPRRSSPIYKCLVTLTYDSATDYFGTVSGAHLSSAAKKAVKDALATAQQQNSITILEPVMHVTIICPESAAGAIQHDLHSARGGQVLEVRDLQDTSGANNAATGDAEINIDDIYAPPDSYDFQKSLRETRKGRLRMLQITAQVPLAEVLDYDSVLRSKTSGHHSLAMALDTFERVTGPREKALL
ncbi:P-loop containing nucleoside triphosphate hydrolase protein [Xylaria bambusicola]|uniref:P-loop containing nucleoside triphosphate hydrolase protein n=1 Tax=Xylaria bambusicola TaxID=326684 RepID=UPI002007D925|nr:P-loop containing nucleoside triphosphate hydrolase protein [Xylaria bambusicola]KAI0509264.1 P-loop containing nucleoside triphosphate hydrolase protein [Xylaria bambusicola]